MEFQGKVKITAALDALARQGVDVGRATLIEWCRKHELGIQLGPNGHWMVDVKKLHEFVTKGTYKKEEGGAEMK
jgi:hypothetical protein